MVIKKLLALCLFSVSLYSAEYEIPQIVLNAIRNNECMEVKGVCDPNVIRINRKKDIVKAKLANFKIKGHHIRCVTAEKCSKTLSSLLEAGINNVDLGAYQINYMYQSSRWKDKGDYTAYFDIEKSELRAREILRGLIDQHGYGWRTLGRYHHFDPENKDRNRNYYRRMYSYIYNKKVSKYEIASIEKGYQVK